MEFATAANWGLGFALMASRRLDEAPPGRFGWLLPIDPVYRPASAGTGWRRVRDAVARRSG